jgi:hypothetical protein
MSFMVGLGVFSEMMVDGLSLGGVLVADIILIVWWASDVSWAALEFGIQWVDAKIDVGV